MTILDRFKYYIFSLLFLNYHQLRLEIFKKYKFDLYQYLNTKYLLLLNRLLINFIIAFAMNFRFKWFKMNMIIRDEKAS